MDKEEKEIRNWSRVHNIPYVRKLIVLLDHERDVHAEDIRALGESLRRETKLMGLLNDSRCPQCKKEPKSK